MNRIDKKFNELRSAGKKAFIAFITAGDPDLKATEALALSFEKAGVDILELGVPFSDPMADGATIQAASYRALQKGVTLKKILASVKSIRTQSQMPLALMSYYNPIYHFGLEKFVIAAKQAGVDGLIIPDLPVDEGQELCRYARREGVSVVFFLAPTTTKARMPAIVKAATGFIYFVSVAGVTGARKSVPSEIAKNIRLARTMTKKPICIGFGVSTPEQVKAMGRISDGVIVGSAIVKEVERLSAEKDMPARVSQFVKKLSAALRA